MPHWPAKARGALLTFLVGRMNGDIGSRLESLIDSGASAQSAANRTPELTRAAARFIEPMLLLRTEALPDDVARWAYHIKLDGYRAVAFNADGRVHLQSRNGNDLGARYAPVLLGLEKLPADTVSRPDALELRAGRRSNVRRRC